MPNHLPEPVPHTAYLLDWDATKANALDRAAAAADLTVESFARVALELLLEFGGVTLADIRVRATRLLDQTPFPRAFASTPA